MVNMVKANVAGEPLQDTRQSVVGAAFAGSTEIPFVVRLPVCMLILMLNIEEPATNRRTKSYDREVNQEKSRDANRAPCPASIAMSPRFVM